jgi:tRNA-dihydrouridine synthase B
MCFGAVMGVKIARKHVGWYLATLPGAREFRGQFNRIETPEAQHASVQQFFVERHNHVEGAAA